MAKIVFNRPRPTFQAGEYLRTALASGHHSGDGSFTKACHALLERSLGVSKALLTTSCTHALEMAAFLLYIKPGDEVIVPSFTFVSTANACASRGAKVVFADVRHDTLNLDEGQLQRLITANTKAIVPVHYAGVGCEMEVIMQIATRSGVAVIEDNAHGLYGKYRGRYLGTFGALATQSFHETKNFSCGEGGALLINDSKLQERAEILREKGTNRSKFFRGQVDKYTWIDFGSSYLPSDLLAAVLLAELEAREEIQQRRQVIWQRYANELKGWANRNSVKLPVVPVQCEQAFHMFYLVLPNFDTRQKFITYLKDNDIMAPFHYLPLHMSPMGKRYGAQPGDCPVAEDYSERLARLSFYNALSEDDQLRIIEVVNNFSV